MGDRVWVKFTIGGELRTDLISDFVDACESEDARDYYSDEPVTVQRVVEGAAKQEPYTVTVTEANYGTVESLESFCEENNIPFLKEWEAGGGFGPGSMIFKADGSPAEEYDAIDGDAVLTESEARRLKTFKAIVAYFARANWSPPALVLVGEPVKAEDLNAWVVRDNRLDMVICDPCPRREAGELATSKTLEAGKRGEPVATSSGLDRFTVRRA